MNKFNLDYAALLGVTVTTYQFDGGLTVVLLHNGVSWRGSFIWGDEAFFNRRVTKWLHTLPWPREDDPRTTPEGTYL